MEKLHIPTKNIDSDKKQEMKDSKYPKSTSNIVSSSPNMSIDEPTVINTLSTNSTSVQSSKNNNISGNSTDEFGDVVFDYSDQIVRSTNLSLKDVPGMKKVKEHIFNSFINPIKNPELAAKYGKKPKGGILLYGPPGCGKTYIMNALVGELGINLLSIKISDILSKWLGESENKIAAVFQTARNNTPIVLFFDEIDAIGMSRDAMSDNMGYYRPIINQLLMEFNSHLSENNNVYIIGATNAPWDVDIALRRPGRFDRSILIAPPDVESRAGIISYYLKDKTVENLSIEELAQLTVYYSGADLSYLCEVAADSAFNDSLHTNTFRPINMNDFRKALEQVKATTASWFELINNHMDCEIIRDDYQNLASYIPQRVY